MTTGDTMTNTTVRPRIRGLHLLLVGALGLAVAPALAACGGDDAPKKKDTKKKAKAKPKKKRGGGGGDKKESLQTYTKVEERVDAEEAKRIRHKFKASDFIPDVTGTENRDPFRSYVVAQVGIGNADEAIQIQPTDICGKDNMVATNYSLRDLRLVGIVLRGTRSYALFRDSAAFGHIVRRGDCLGKEKARVASIGSGFVSLEVIPDVAPNQPARPPQERSIQLYPEELQLSDPTAPSDQEIIEDDRSGDAEQ